MSIVIQLVRRLGRAWPSSPILDKEMRVSSRRKSLYLLRAGYLACLTLFVALTWMGTAGGAYARDNPAMVAAYMASVGQRIVHVVLWFQFVAAQVIALFSLGTALPSEIVRGTMTTLACTPLSTYQIVLGKLLSKLLQVLLLLAMSLPLLAIVRVFGGVQWGTVVAGLAVTVSSALLVGAWSLLLSIRNRSLLRLLAITAFFYAVFFGLGAYVSFGILGPVVSMMYVTEGVSMMRPFYGASMFLVTFNCLAMVGVAFALLGAASGRLREEIAIPAGSRRRHRPVPYYAAVGPPPLPSYYPWPGGEPPPLPGARASARAAPPGASPPLPARPLAVKGPALIWKDLRTFLPATRAGVIFACCLAAFILLATYTPLLSPQHDNYLYIHWFFLCLYLAGGAFMTVLAASTAITVEKESRALPILLTAPISDTQIIVSKATGVFYRALACWALLLLHLFVFTAAGQIRPAGALGLALVAAYLCVFLTGLGLYVSSILRGSSNALMCTLGICLLLWLALPALTDAVSSGSPQTVADVVSQLNPYEQVMAICRQAIGSADGFSGSPRRDYASSSDAAGLPQAVLESFLAYTGLGLLLARRARILMRRRLFV